MATLTEPVAKRRLPERPVWKELDDSFQKASNVHLQDLFAIDGERGDGPAMGTRNPVEALCRRLRKYNHVLSATGGTAP